MARWGMPTPPQYFAGKKVNSGVTNIRQTTSSHWRAWLGPEHRCLVPFTSFAETTLPDGSRPPIWFAFDKSRPLAFFAGIWARWTSAQTQGGQGHGEFFGFLTTEPNAEVRAVHPKARGEAAPPGEEIVDAAESKVREASGVGTPATSGTTARPAAVRNTSRRGWPQPALPPPWGANNSSSAQGDLGHRSGTQGCLGF